MQGAAAPGTAKVAQRIGAGRSGVIHAGEWMVEQPTTIHTSPAGDPEQVGQGAGTPRPATSVAAFVKVFRTLREREK
jgi:hypothetical protein